MQPHSKRFVVLTAMLLFPIGCAVREGAPVTMVTSQYVDADGITAGKTRLDDLTVSVQQALLAKDLATDTDGKKQFPILAISGGGSDGAYAAGLLTGWSASTSRPKFRIVTGVSTGALIATFAFLGPDYDARLKTAYTTVNENDIFNIKPLLPAILFGDSVADVSPFKRLIEQTITEPMLTAVAAEHRAGRRIYVATTNFDRDELVIWDMGAIAASTRPDKVALYRKVLLASSSIPVMFPPVYFPVQSGGQTYQQMHVDGGVSAEIFVPECLRSLPAMLKTAGLDPANVRATLYVIRNGKLKEDVNNVKPNLPDIATRTVDSLVNSQALGDLRYLYQIAQAGKMAYQLTYIPEDCPQQTKSFDKAEMNRMFWKGYDLGLHNQNWHLEPPHNQRY